MASTLSRKTAQPSKLRTRLALAFGIFALIVVTALGLLEAWFWESTHGNAQMNIGPILLVAGALVVAVAAFAGYLLAGPLARPMEMWAEAADRIGLGERHVNFPQGGGSHELARVTAAMQSMFARLSEKEDVLQDRIKERTAALVQATEALDAERKRLSDALEGSRLAFWDLDLESGEIRLSAEWARMLGDPEGEVVTSVQELLARVPEEEHAMISEQVFAVLKGQNTQYDLDHRVKRADGTWMWVRSRGRVTARASDGRAMRLVGTNADIAARKSHEDRQRASEARLKLVMDGVNLSICHVDLTGRILSANKRFHEFYGIRDGSAAGRHVREIAGEDGAAAFERCLPQLISGNEVQYHREARVQGRAVNIEMRLVPHRDDLGVTESVYAILTDTTERRAAERILERQAMTDATTGLPNQRCFADRLAQVLARPQRPDARCAVLHVGLDGFKAVNDAQGHDAGDALLRQVGARYVAAVRTADLVARLGGDAFAVLVENCRSIDDAERVASKLVDALKSAFELPRGEVRLSCSVGVSIHPADGEDAQTLMRHAGEAMRRAKAAGRSRFARHIA